MREVLFVSKPVVPPWNDGNKNLVRDVARALTRYRARVLVPRGASFEQPPNAEPSVLSEPIYQSTGTHAPSRLENARVLERLCVGPRVGLWHFFFAPNPPTLVAGRMASRLRSARTIHTVASAPDDLEARAKYLFADRIVALSQHTARRLASVGVAATVIPPALRALTVTPEQQERAQKRYGLRAPYVLYAGDLEFGDGAATFVRAAAKAKEFSWVVASRPKTPRAHDARRLYAAEALAFGAEITWLGELDDLHAVVAGAAAMVLVTDSLHGKVDWPLVLLEALSLGVPIFVAEGTAAGELIESGGAMAVPVSNPDALVTALRSWSSRTEREQRACVEAARSWVHTTCDPARVAAQYEALYDTL